MKQLFLSLCLVMAAMSLQAQSKAEQLKQIRQVYAQAKEKAGSHVTYREFLFDPQKGHLMFSFMKAETHAGFKVETRYYYDGAGNLIEQKHKINDQEASADAHSWSTAEGDREMAVKYLQMADAVMCNM